MPKSFFFCDFLRFISLATFHRPTPRQFLLSPPVAGPIIFSLT